MQVAPSAADAHSALIGKEWPDLDPAVLDHATDFLIRSRTWTGVAIDRAGVEHWTGILHEARLTVDRVSYADIATDVIFNEVSP